jgi:hypothetical protein
MASRADHATAQEFIMIAIVADSVAHEPRDRPAVDAGLQARAGQPHSLERALEDLNERAMGAVEAGYDILILSDRDADRHRTPIPSLLATSGVHHHLVRQAARTRRALVTDRDIKLVLGPDFDRTPEEQLTVRDARRAPSLCPHRRPLPPSRA